MSPQTPKPEEVQLTRPLEVGPPRMSTRRRIAAAGLVAVSMLLPLGQGQAPVIKQLIRIAQSHTNDIGIELGLVNTQVFTLPETLRTEITDALDSAQAATAEASAALASAAAHEDDISVLALNDAQIALDAAYAQVRHVAELADRAGLPIAAYLHQLRDHLDALRR